MASTATFTVGVPLVTRPSGRDYVGGNYHPFSINEYTRAQVTIGEFSDNVLNGKAFKIGKIGTLGNEADLDIVVTTPSSPDILLTIRFSTSAQAELRLYENTTVGAGGATLTSFDINRVIANTPGTVVKEDPTITAVGTLLEVSQLGYAGSGNSSFGGDSEIGIFLKASEDYLFRLTTLAALDYSLALVWSERTEFIL